MKIDDPDNEGLVISLATGQPVTDGPTQADRLGGRFCAHRSWVVDRRGRTLTCQSCGKNVDPFEALVRVARDYDRVIEAKQEYKRVNEALGRLQDEERRTKARLKNASRKDADAAVAAERAKWLERMRRFEWKAGEIAREAGVIQRGLRGEGQ